jgi:hypothetical protein
MNSSTDSCVCIFRQIHVYRRMFNQWIADPLSRPVSGSVVKLTTENGCTQLSYH